MIKLNKVYCVRNDEFYNLLVKVVEMPTYPHDDLYYCELVDKDYNMPGYYSFNPDNCNFFREDELCNFRVDKLKRLLCIK